MCALLYNLVDVQLHKCCSCIMIPTLKSPPPPPHTHLPPPPPLKKHYFLIHFISILG